MPMQDVDRYLVLGNPIAHSQSPRIHAAFAERTGQLLHYGRHLCPQDGFAAEVRALLAAPDPGLLRGCNVTVPFKQDALALADAVSPRAQLAGAVNVLSFVRSADGSVRIEADNSDGIGLCNDLQAEGVTLRGRRILLVGAGGAGAGVLAPLLAAGPRELVVANRTADKARALVERHAAVAARHGVALAAATLDAPGRAFDLLINATAASLAGAGAPVPDDVFDGADPARPRVAIDLMYGPAAEPFLRWAAARGARPLDGLGMLVEQAAEAFRIWRGVAPPSREVLAQLRAQLQAPPAAP